MVIVTFGPAVAGSGVLTCAALFDAATAGTCVAYWPLSAGILIAAGRTQTIGGKAISIAFNDVATILADGSISYQAGQRIGKHNGSAPFNAGIATQFTS